MKKILNSDVSNVVDEMLLGYLTAYRNFYRKVDAGIGAKRKDL